MKFPKDTRGVHRYIAMDLHKEYVLAGGQNARQEWVMQPRRVGIEKFREWAAANLRKGDAVILETTGNVWDIYDIVAPLVKYVVVAHARGVRQIAEARVKTDKKDVERLLCVLIADTAPEVWVPPLEVRQLRSLISYRSQLVKMGTMIRNRLRSLLHRHNIVLPEGARRTKPGGRRRASVRWRKSKSARNWRCWKKSASTKRKWTRSWSAKAWESNGAGRRCACCNCRGSAWSSA